MSDTLTPTSTSDVALAEGDLMLRQRAPLTGYRDYLIGIWKAEAARASLTPEQMYQQLVDRFHQDFATTDAVATQANEVLIPIVKKVLTDPAPAGFGIPAVNIPARPQAQSARDYLNALIEKSGTTAIELGLRYRLDLTRSDSAMSSPVQENIATMLGFFRDHFQAKTDPFPMPPSTVPIGSIYEGTSAPFFLEYGEWAARADAIFYPENVFSMLRNLRASELAESARNVPNTNAWYDWYQKAAAVFVDVQRAVGWISSGEYDRALNMLSDTKRGADRLIKDRVSANAPADRYDVPAAMKRRQDLQVSNKQQLLDFERYDGGQASGGGSVTFGLVLYAGYFHYLWKGDVYLTLERYPEAADAFLWLVRGALGTATEDTRPGWNNAYPSFIYTDGSLPYTWKGSWSAGGSSGDGVVGAGTTWIDTPGIPGVLHGVDLQFVKLRLGNALLEWADAIYRADDPSLIERARELYKTVLLIHNANPGISPEWDSPILVIVSANAAVTGQLSRARIGFTKSSTGLNYFGFTNDVVPVQRYRTLKDQADRYAALAVAAERDFLTATANLEQLSIDAMRTSNMLAKARSQQSIANEQSQIAGYNVEIAKQQVAEVQKQIDAKKAEIEDHDSFFGQWSDFISGASDTVTSFFKGAKDTPAGNVSDQIQSGIKAEMGFSNASSAGLLGLGAGASVLAGYGLFAYVGYSSMSSMASAAKTREGELKRLQDVTMPMAQNNVTARQREVTIAQLQATVAAADITLAQNLIAFNDQRLLNTEFWASVAQILQRVLRRYLDLGAWAAWLAERALAFELNQSLRIVRMDYRNAALRNVTSGDLLQADLAELEAARLSGERALVPFTYSLSLVEEFPLAFGALKALGSCTFSSREADLRAFFPGTYGHRIRDAKVTVRTALAGARVRGTFANHGVSLSSVDEALNTRALLRFPDAIAVSETNAGGPPDPRLAEVLGPFEGTGLDTTWTLQLDPAASGGSWDAISDVVIEVQGLARYGEALRQNNSLNGRPKPAFRFVMMSARTFAKEALAALRKNGNGNVTLDFREFPFPIGERNRTVSNVVVLLPGAKGAPVNAHLHLNAPQPLGVDFMIKDRRALSNGKPLRMPGSTQPPAPLNAAIGVPVDQPWSILINAGADLSGLADLVIGIDYAANLPNLPMLKEGATGADVRWAQYLLVRRTMTYDQINGKFDAVTKHAVEQFQRNSDLEVDGIIGPLTWYALDGERPRPPRLAFEAEGEVVRKLQTALNQGRGTFAPNTNPILTVDGKFRTNTETAVKGMQKHNNIPEDGVVSMQTWAIPTRVGTQVLAELCGVPGPR